MRKTQGKLYKGNCNIIKPAVKIYIKQTNHLYDSNMVKVYDRQQENLHKMDSNKQKTLREGNRVNVRPKDNDGIDIDIDVVVVVELSLSFLLLTSFVTIALTMLLHHLPSCLEAQTTRKCRG